MESSGSEEDSDHGVNVPRPDNLPSNVDLRAVVVGATGATGKALVSQLLKDKHYSRVTTIGRRPLPLPEGEPGAEKLIQHTVDVDRIEDQKQLWNDHDVAFCCLGTTRSQAGSAEAFRKVDLHLVTKCAQLAKDAGVPHFSLVSSTGADANSFFLYMKTKGQAEEAVRKLAFERYSIWRPPLLGRGKEARFVEKVAAFFSGAMPVETLASAMRNEAIGRSDQSGTWMYGTRDINDWAARK